MGRFWAPVPVAMVFVKRRKSQVVRLILTVTGMVGCVKLWIGASVPASLRASVPSTTTQRMTMTTMGTQTVTNNIQEIHTRKGNECKCQINIFA